MKLKKVRLNSLSILYILNIKNFGRFLFLFQCLIELSKTIYEFFLTKMTLKLILNVPHHFGNNSNNKTDNRFPKMTLYGISLKPFYLTEKHQIFISYEKTFIKKNSIRELRKK